VRAHYYTCVIELCLSSSLLALVLCLHQSAPTVSVFYDALLAQSCMLSFLIPSPSLPHTPFFTSLPSKHPRSVTSPSVQNVAYLLLSATYTWNNSSSSPLPLALFRSPPLSYRFVKVRALYMVHFPYTTIHQTICRYIHPQHSESAY